ncbi:protease HtpX [Paraburkholderia sp. A3RO-2L]|jgi:heat shock protein HtpX|uniref:protease HtpX n=1 Tax=Paraburkholderia sp. A3RO-2L TaxID=3028376 RepID=UPI003DA7B644
MKRIALLLATNLAVMLVLSMAASLLGVSHYLTHRGLHMGALLGFCFVFGFGGAFISLLLSKPIAKWTTGAEVISGNEGPVEGWLIAVVEDLAKKAGIGMPEVAIYEGSANAFATGFSRDRALVAVSTGLLRSMDRLQLEAVLAHEVSHVASGDMVTLTLIQGVLNTFVIFLSRVVGYFLDRVLMKNDRDDVGMGYVATVFVLELVFGLLASLLVAAYSRQREYRADAGAAKLLGSPASMVSALKALAGQQDAGLPKALSAFGIRGNRVWALLASHPSIESRIAALQG